MATVEKVLYPIVVNINTYLSNYIALFALTKMVTNSVKEIDAKK